MDDPLAFLASLALLVNIVTRRVLEELVIDALFFFGDLGLVVLEHHRHHRARLRRVGRHHGVWRGNDRATATCMAVALQGLEGGVMMTKPMGVFLVMLGLMAGATSCSDERTPATNEPTLGTGTGPEVATGAPPPTNEVAATLSSDEVVALTTVSSQGEVSRGAIAQLRAVNGEVQAYAARMVADYTQANDRIQAIAAPRIASDPRARVRQRHQRLITQDVQAQTGAAFDEAYMSAQVEAHAEEIATLERSLLPSVFTAGQAPATVPPAGLRGQLEAMRAMAAQHLVEALQIEQRLLQARSNPPITTN